MKQLHSGSRGKDTPPTRTRGHGVDQEFATLPASVVHREVATVSDGLIANARFTDHVAVLTGRFAAEHLSAALPPVERQTLRTGNQRHIARSHWWTRH